MHDHTLHLYDQKGLHDSAPNKQVPVKDIRPGPYTGSRGRPRAAKYSQASKPFKWTRRDPNCVFHFKNNLTFWHLTFDILHFVFLTFCDIWHFWHLDSISLLFFTFVTFELICFTFLTFVTSNAFVLHFWHFWHLWLLNAFVEFLLICFTFLTSERNLLTFLTFECICVDIFDFWTQLFDDMFDICDFRKPFCWHFWHLTLSRGTRLHRPKEPGGPGPQGTRARAAPGQPTGCFEH